VCNATPCLYRFIIHQPADTEICRQLDVTQVSASSHCYPLLPPIPVNIWNGLFSFSQSLLRRWLLQRYVLIQWTVTCYYVQWVDIIDNGAGVYIYSSDSTQILSAPSCIHWPTYVYRPILYYVDIHSVDTSPERRVQWGLVGVTQNRAYIVGRGQFSGDRVTTMAG